MPSSPAASVAGLLASAQALLPHVIELRRRLHRRPEVGLDLPETQATIIEELTRLGIRATPGRSLSSVTAVIDGARPGATIILRADMDALPLSEETGLDFASEIEGSMHACGHDTHVAMLLGAARLLVEWRNRLAGRVVLMFQPGEEGYHGARLMLEEGLLEGLDEGTVSAFALHVQTRYPSGTLALRSGQILAASDRFELVIRGRGGHASAPYAAVDPIAIAAEIVTALQTMVTRRFDVFDPAIVTVGHIEAGATHNIIPETARLRGTTRALSDATRIELQALLRRVVEGICAAHGATGEVTIIQGYSPTVNDPAVTALVGEVAEAMIGADAVQVLASPLMGGEDFSYVLERVPGCFAFLGARPVGTDPDAGPMNHSNLVVFDEAAMAAGVALLAGVAIRTLTVA